MNKQNAQMPVKYKLQGAGQETDFYWERSLDLILSPGCYMVEIEHAAANVGLPFEFCGQEHYIVGNLVVTDNGTKGVKQNNRLTGQALVVTLQGTTETKIYTRTIANGEWGEWRSFAYTGMYDNISTTDELLASVEELIKDNEKRSFDILLLENKNTEFFAQDSFTIVGKTDDKILGYHTFFKNVKIEYTGGTDTDIDLSSIMLSLLKKGYTEGKAEIRWSALINGKREYLFGNNVLIDLADINNDGYTHIEHENTACGVKIFYDVDLKNPNFPVNVNVFTHDTEPTMVVSRNCIFKTVESYYRQSFNEEFEKNKGYYIKVTASSGAAPVVATELTNATYVELDVAEGETYDTEAYGSAYVAAWAVIDAERKVLLQSGNVPSYTGKIVMPENAFRFIVNGVSGMPLLNKVVSPIDDFSVLYKKSAENKTNIKYAIEAVEELRNLPGISYNHLFADNLGFFIKINNQAVISSRADLVPVELSGASYALIDVHAGERYVISAQGSALVAAWAVVDIFGRVIEYAEFSANEVVVEKTMPKSAAKLVVNSIFQKNNPELVLKVTPTTDIPTIYGKCDTLERWTDAVNILNGKKILCLGDSITELMGDGGLRYSDHIARKTGAIVYNGGIGAAHMEQRANMSLTPDSEHVARAALDLPAIVTALVTDDWNYQDAAVEYLAANGDDNSAIIQELKGVNLQEIDVVTIFIGTNDKDSVIGEIGDTTAVGNSLGGLYTAISKLLTANPNISIYYFSPIVRYLGKLNEAWDDSLWCDNYVGARGVAFPDMVDKFIEGAEHWKIPVCNMYRTMGVNQFNIKAIMHSTNGDGTHPYRGYKMIANKMISFIAANNNLNV